jgi:hypothetical protein
MLLAEDARHEESARGGLELAVLGQADDVAALGHRRKR